MFKKNLLVLLTVACAAYRVHASVKCTSIAVIPGFSCDDTAAAAGIDVNQLTKFNPDLDCSLLQAGKRLCITPGTLSKRATDASGSNINNTEATANSTGGKDTQGARKALPGQALQTNDLHWDDPSPIDCTQYGLRLYRARLWEIPGDADWDTTCKQTPVSIPGLITNKLPDLCENLGLSGEFGTWVVPTALDDTYCRPNWGDFTFDACTDNLKAHFYSRLWNIQGNEGNWERMCVTSPATINNIEFSKPDSCDNKGILGIYGNWNVPYYAACSRWGPLTDNGCSDTPGIRKWSATLLDASNDPCAQAAVVQDVYFAKPSDCNGDAKTGTFNVPDSTCGVPPCPDNMTWDYKYGMCMDCSWDGQTAPPDLSATQEDIRARSLASEPKREASSEANKLQKRVGCLPFNVPDGRTIAALVNNIQAWIGDNGAGPTVDQIVANDQVRQAFQLAWADTYPEPNRMRETGGWIYADARNPQNFFIQRVTTQLPPLVNIDPPPSSNMAINIAHPDLEPTPVPDGFVLVATFHTHPGFLRPGIDDPSLPSLFDNRNEWRRGVPGIIIHDRGVTAYGPRSRAQIDPAGPQNFPMANQDIDNIAAHDFDRGRQVGSWAPACVPNQPEPPDAPSTSGCFGSGHTEL